MTEQADFLEAQAFVEYSDKRFLDAYERLVERAERAAEQRRRWDIATLAVSGLVLAVLVISWFR